MGLSIARASSAAFVVNEEPNGSARRVKKLGGFIKKIPDQIGQEKDETMARLIWTESTLNDLEIIAEYEVKTTSQRKRKVKRKMTMNIFKAL